jgi:dienelactone hydrolase
MIPKILATASAAILLIALLVFVGLAGSAKAFSYGSDNVNGTEMLSYFPPDPKGVVYFFHGTGGSARKFSHNAGDLAQEVVKRGYAIVFLSSSGRRWKPAADPQQSADIATVAQARALLRSRGQLGKGTNEYAVGLSSGGGFASYAAEIFNFDAVAIYSAKGYDGFLEKPSYDRPTIFFPGDADSMIPLDRVQANADILRQRGIPVAVDVRRGEGHGLSASKADSMFRFFAQYQ